MAQLNFISISACVFSHVLAAWVTRACLSGTCFLFFIVCILALCRLLFSCFCRVSFLQHSHVFCILQRVQLMFPVFASLVIHGKIASHDCRNFGWGRGALLAGAEASTDSTSTGTSAHHFLGAVLQSIVFCWVMWLGQKY